MVARKNIVITAIETFIGCVNFTATSLQLLTWRHLHLLVCQRSVRTQADTLNYMILLFARLVFRKDSTRFTKKVRFKVLFYADSNAFVQNSVLAIQLVECPALRFNFAF